MGNPSRPNGARPGFRNTTSSAVQAEQAYQQRDLLTSTDAMTQAQGFHFSTPVAADRAGELLRQGRTANDEASRYAAYFSGNSLSYSFLTTA
jgi:hypothetical protein